MCGAYKPLNLVTPQDKYPMPILEELFDNIGDLNTFTIEDLRQGFNHIGFVVKDHKKTTFHGSNKLWACDAVWIEECTCFLSTNHGLDFQRGRFPKVLHR